MGTAIGEDERWLIFAGSENSSMKQTSASLSSSLPSAAAAPAGGGKERTLRKRSPPEEEDRLWRTPVGFIPSVSKMDYLHRCRLNIYIYTDAPVCMYRSSVQRNQREDEERGNRVVGGLMWRRVAESKRGGEEIG